MVLGRRALRNHSILKMIEDLIHGPRSSMERAEKRNTFGPMPDPKERMALFMAKLNAQAKRAETNLFNGVAIYFNGHTDKVGVLQLKQAVQKNGGMVNYAFSVTHTTHIVCTNLCASKLNAFSGTRPLKKKIHIVHPDWIIDSLKAHELQPESKYEIVVTKDTTTIMDFLPSKEDQKADSKSEAKADSDDGKEDSSSTSNEAEESVALESGSMSLSLSTQESQEKDKQYKPVQHPLLHSRRSSTSSHSASRSKSSMDQFPNRVQPSVKQARYNSIMKRGLIRNAQKSFR